MRDKLDPGQPWEKALYDSTPEELAAAGVRPLPGTLLEAIRACAPD